RNSVLLPKCSCQCQIACSRTLSEFRSDPVVFARRDRKRFVVRADETLAAFVELEWARRATANCLDRPGRPANFFKTQRRQKDLNQAEDFPPLSSSPSPDPQSQNQHSGERRKDSIWQTFFVEV